MMLVGVLGDPWGSFWAALGFLGFLGVLCGQKNYDILFYFYLVENAVQEKWQKSDRKVAESETV